MVFHFRSADGHEPTPDDCRAVADAYGEWENSGFALGYFVHRGEYSYFTRANAFGIGNSPRASFIDDPFERSGFIPDLAFWLLPSSCCPIVRWATTERGPETGRTYAVGLTLLTSDPLSDKSTVSGAYGVVLQSTFDTLRVQVQALTGFVQCHLARSKRGGLGPGQHLLDITGCGIYELMGTQRRRTRP